MDQETITRLNNSMTRALENLQTNKVEITFQSTWGEYTRAAQQGAEYKWFTALKNATDPQRESCRDEVENLTARMEEILLGNQLPATSSSAMSNALESIEREVISNLLRRIKHS